MTRIGVGQADFQVGTPKENAIRIRRLLEDADRQGVEILVLPELANSGYVFESADEARACAERIPDGPVCRLLADWSRGGRLAASGLCEESGGRLYNAAPIFIDGSLAAVYRKAHLFLNEPDFFTPGEQEPPVVAFHGSRVGLMICFDWIFPEMARVLALQGAQLILHPSNLVLPYAQQAMLIRSMENRVFTATANRCGIERGTAFSGRSQVTAPDGRLLAQAESDFSGVLSAEVDLAKADDKYITARNHVLHDRKVGLYGRILKE